MSMIPLIFLLLLSGCAINGCATHTYKPNVEIGKLYSRCFIFTEKVLTSCMYGVTITHEAYEGEIDRKALLEKSVMILDKAEPGYIYGAEKNKLKILE